MALNQAGSSRTYGTLAVARRVWNGTPHIAPTGKGCVCLMGTYYVAVLQHGNETDVDSLTVYPAENQCHYNRTDSSTQPRAPRANCSPRAQEPSAHNERAA